jgi:hypothetical protein
VADHAYEVTEHRSERLHAAMAVVCAGFAVLGGRNGNLPMLGVFVPLSLFSAGAAVHALLWAPYRIVVGATGLRWVARRREMTVLWSELEVVEVRLGMGTKSLRWWRNGRVVTTPGGFTNLHRLLSDIEDRAPHVRVFS